MSGTAVDVRGLHMAYGERPVLEGIDLAIAPGERVCLIGPNGAGKTSLLRCLTGATGVAGGRSVRRDGTVLLDGVPVDELSRSSISRRVAVVPGDVHLPFATRVDEVVALGRLPHEHPLRGPGPADHAAVAKAMDRVGVSHLATRDCRELSLGERRLVVLAMAIAQGGGLLLLDEPTVHLDLRHQVQVMELLCDINERDGVTVLAVLHDLSLAAHFFPRVSLLDGGRLVADGSPEAVLTAERIQDVYRVDPRFAPIGCNVSPARSSDAGSDSSN